ncbi:MAG: chromate transporter [Elusimicrobia bacterium]|nr:chromate transporter [Elusimicrobiota bacterium]
MPNTSDKPRGRSSLWQLLFYFLQLGTTGFGGPIALAEYMERDLVEARGWISKTDYVQGLALAELAPGPLAAQLAIYLGYTHSGVLGATLVAITFVLPSFLMVIALAAAYVRFGGLPWVQAVFYGIGAAVMGIIARSAYKLTKRTVGKKPLLWVIFTVMAVVTAVTRSEIVWLFILCGVVSLAVYAPPQWLRNVRSLMVWPWLGLLAPQGQPPASTGTLWTIVTFFAKAGAFVFGSGLAIVPFLYGGVVRDFHWLNERQFLDAVAVAMITPGPVVITAGFIGYLVAGLAGACLAAFGVFFPVYLFVILPAPWYKRHGRNPQLVAFVEGVTAAAVGAITGAVYILAQGAIRDVSTALIALGSLLILIYVKIPEPMLVGIAGIIGLFLYRG